jgi:hypothetical protein
MNSTTLPAVAGPFVDRVVRPRFEHGFWWWYDKNRKGWFIGCAPAFGTPRWAQ